MVVPTALLTAAFDQDASDAWMWLWKITVDITVSATTVVFLTNQAEEVSFGGETYLPYPMRGGSIRQGTDGDLVSMDLTLSNVTRQVSVLVETGQGLANMPVILTLVKRDQLADGAALTFNFTIGSVSLTNEAASITLETPNYFQRKSPRDVFSRDRCRWRFKGKECGYVGSAVTSCDKRLGRCVEIGDSEDVEKLIRNHPARFGGFPGIKRSLGA